MCEVASPTLHEATGGVEVDPVKEPHVGLLAVEAHALVIEGICQLLHVKDGLTDRLNEPVLTLHTNTRVSG